jgi:hypothetical protein
MFRKMTLFSLTLLVSTTVAGLHFLTRQNKTDLADYEKLIQESVELRSKSALERQPAHQLRTQVQKDIWTLNNRQRLHYRLKSQRSDLTIGQKKGKIDAVEKLQKIDCCMQEEFDGDGQQIRYLFADDGTYFFPSHKFIAEEVDLYFFSLQGHELPRSWPSESPFLRGTANEVIFSASEGFPAFTATHLNAEFDEKP